jgi:electron transfer flavoprotein beta subunit
MNIAVTVCFVPDSASVIEIADGAVDRSMLNFVLNPYDEYALEEAVRQRERAGAGVVTVFSVAPASFKEPLRKVLAKGADNAVLLPAEGLLDTFRTASILAEAITAYYGDVMPDLIFAGKQSTDFRSAQVPVMLAEQLGIASLSGASVLTASGRGFDAARDIENGIEYCDITPPALISVEKGLNTPRNAGIKAVMEARKKPITLFDAVCPEKPMVKTACLEPLARKKQCRFLADEKELLRILAHDRNLF